MEYRAPVQEIETKFSIALFLFRNRKRDKDTNMVHIDSTITTPDTKSKIRNKKSLLYSGSIGEDPYDKPHRCNLDG